MGYADNVKFFVIVYTFVCAGGKIMEENVIIKSKHYNIKKVFKIVAIICLAFLVCDLIFEISYYCDRYSVYENHEHSSYCYETKYIYDYEYDYYSGTFEKVIEDSYEVIDCIYRFSPDFEWLRFFVIGFSPLIVWMFLSLLITFWLSSYEMIVTDKRIYGKVAWGKRVDLPLDSISATAILRIFKGISVSSASGKIRFLLIKNVDEIYNEINKLLIERQKKESPVGATITMDAISSNNSPEDLIGFKELLDKGIITQEEFEAKKKQILGL